MSVPLFRNDRLYDIDVPTPSGGGRRVPPGCYVAGAYFLAVQRQLQLFTRMDEGHVFDPKKLMCSYNDKGELLIYEIPAGNTAVLGKDGKVENTTRLADTPPPEPKRKGRPPKSDADKLEASLNEAMGEMGNFSPGPEDLKTMPADVLRRQAAKLGLSTIGTRDEILERITRRISG